MVACARTLRGRHAKHAVVLVVRVLLARAGRPCTVFVGEMCAADDRAALVVVVVVAVLRPGYPGGRRAEGGRERRPRRDRHGGHERRGHQGGGGGIRDAMRHKGARHVIEHAAAEAVVVVVPLRKVGRARQAVFALHAQLVQELRHADRAIREQATRPHELAADRVEAVLGDGARDVVAGLERVLDAQQVVRPPPRLFRHEPAFGAHGNRVLGVVKVARKVAEKVEEQLADRVRVVGVPYPAQGLHVVVKVDGVALEHDVVLRQLAARRDPLQVREHRGLFDVDEKEEHEQGVPVARQRARVRRIQLPALRPHLDKEHERTQTRRIEHRVREEQARVFERELVVEADVARDVVRYLGRRRVADLDDRYARLRQRQDVKVGILPDELAQLLDELGRRRQRRAVLAAVARHQAAQVHVRVLQRKPIRHAAEREQRRLRMHLARDPHELAPYALLDAVLVLGRQHRSEVLDDGAR